VGFGIRDAATAQRIARVADAVVVGSRIVQEIADSPPEAAAARVGELIRGFRAAMDSAEALA
jgi:tryptophan synthase alpha chain